jgi:glycosyltransferase involved in cell wall biosynthesis
MKPMRICFLSRRFFPAISGMSVYALNLVRELVDAGHEVTMISQYRGDAAGTEIYGGGPPPDVPGVRVIGLEALGEQDGGAFERDVETMRRTAVEAGPFDIVHAQYGYPTGLAGLLAAADLGVPGVVSIQGGDGHWVGSCCATHERAMRAVLDGADALLIGSRSFAEEVHERLGTPVERFTIVPGAVDCDRFAPNGGAPADAPFRLLYHGRADRRKGLLDFVEAVERLDRPAEAVVSGIGPDLDAARTRAAGLPVRFTGRADYDDAPDRYRAADAFVSPTYAEGFSNTILEAMASGLPIVSCRAVGVVDCLRDQDNALLVEPGDVEALTGALRQLVDDAALRSRLAARALEEARSVYSWTTVGRQIMDVYASVRAGGRFVAPDPAIEPCRFRASPHLL